MKLTYKTPEPVVGTFTRGEIVEVCDRALVVVSRVQVARVGTRVTRLVDGRRFRTSDGWWIGVHGTWPFPSIRHAEKAMGDAT